MNKQTEDDSVSQCSSEEEVTHELNRPKIDRLLKEKVNLKRIIINVALTQYPVVSEVAQDLGWIIQQNKQAGDWDVCWTDFSIEPSILIRMHFHQKINHFPGIHLIARKNLLGTNLMSMKSQMPDQFEFFPSTWMLPYQYSEFRAFYESKQPGKTRTYIVKPQADCQGRGIFLTRNIKQLQGGRHYVIQRYVTKPYLIDGLKFDFRIYVLLAGSPLRAYVYEQGLARFATVAYEQPNQSNMDNMCMHLTNYAINKVNPNFVFNTNAKQMNVGHKRSLTSIYKLLEKKGEDIDGLKAKINDIITKTILTGMPSIDHQYRHCQPQQYSGNMCFHVLGFDIMLNSKCEPILIQVNHTPSFTTDTPLDQNIKYRLIKDSLNLMNINTKVKAQLFNKSQQYNQQRLLTGKRQIYHGGQKPKQFIDAQNERDIYEEKNLGGFQKIHPVNNRSLQQKYDKIYEVTSKMYFQKDPSALQKEGKKLKKDQYKQNKKSTIDRRIKQQSQTLDLGRNQIYRTYVSKQRKGFDNLSQPKVNKNPPVIDSSRRLSINKTTKNYLNNTAKDGKGFQIKLIESEIIFPQNKKNTRLLGLKHKKSIKQSEQKNKNIPKAGSYIIPKIFNIGFDSERNGDAE